MILFVDYCDVFRAPMAAALYRKLYHQNAESAGIYTDAGAALGDAVCPPALHGHTAKQITAKQICCAEKIICMTRPIARDLCREYPDCAEKMIILQDVPDPLGQGAEEYAACITTIQKQLERML